MAEAVVDILGVQYRSWAIVNFVRMTGASVQIVNYNPNRTALLIANPQSDTTFVAFGTVAEMDKGLSFANARPDILLDLPSHGAMVHGPWSAICVAGTPWIMVVESFLCPCKLRG